MATVVNNPSNDGGFGMSYVLGLILLLVVAVLFFVYGLPRLTGAGTGTGASVNLPSTVNVQSK